LSNSKIDRTNYQMIDRCLACNSANLLLYLDLGLQALANDFKANIEDMPDFPLALNLCQECYHSQLTVSVEPEILFSNYLYVSGTSTTLYEYFGWFTDNLITTHGQNLNVLDLASNDGSFLKVVKAKGHTVLGIDPAANLVSAAAENGVTTICEFWPGVSSTLLAKKFDVVVGMNVLAHVPDPRVFLEEIKRVLTDSGRIIIQTSQAKMFVNGEFDTAYHEHLSFFNTKSMAALAKRSGLELTDAFHTPIHGTSYVWVFSTENNPQSQRLQNLEEEENLLGLFDKETYRQFSIKAKEKSNDVQKIVAKLRDIGYSFWGYGAAAKGNTFINFSGLKLDGMIDDNPLKQNLLSPGGGVKVHSNSILRELPPRTCFILPAWNFKNEIRQKLYNERGEKQDIILTYFPDVRIEKLDGSSFELL
jgi:ubiquinone/menaquinone biosynthesis C-methylase UbiE